MIALVGDELRRVNTDGKSEVLGTIVGATSCDVDRAHGVVWFQTATSLGYYDLLEKAVVPAVTGLPAQTADPYTWQVTYGGGDAPSIAAGTADGLEDCVALEVAIGPTPAVRGLVVAHGDREAYCEEFFDPQSFEPVTDHPLLERLSAGRIDTQALARLHERRRHPGSDDPSPLLPAADPTPVVDPARCEEVPEDCGQVEYLGGGRLYSVITSNSRGDFFHETRELFDMETARYWDPTSGAFHQTPGQTAPPELEVIGGSAFALAGDRILDLTELKTAVHLEGLVCGWQ